MAEYADLCYNVFPLKGKNVTLQKCCYQEIYNILELMRTSLTHWSHQIGEWPQHEAAVAFHV